MPGGRALVFRCGNLLLASLPLADLFNSQTDRLKHVVTVNAEIFSCAHQNRELEKVLAETLNTIDGRVLQWVCGALYPGWDIQRRAGSDFIYDLAAYSAARSEGLFLLGASTESNRRSVEALRARFPSLRLAGYSPPFCSNIRCLDWNQSILEHIEQFRPTHLVVSFGPAKQEFWIAQNAKTLFGIGVRCAYGLGGTLDFVSGTKRRAPRWVQVAGVEWLFRLLCEPRQRFLRTLRMFKMPYFAARTPLLEIRPLASPAAHPAQSLPFEHDAA